MKKGEGRALKKSRPSRFSKTEKKGFGTLSYRTFYDRIALLEKSISEIEKFGKECSAYMRYVQEAKERKDEKLLNYAAEHFYYSYLMNIGHVDYKIDKFALLLDREKQNEHFDRISRLRGITAKAVNGDLWVSFPHPPKRYSHYSNRNKLAVSHQISKIEGELSRYYKKALHLVHVVPDDGHSYRYVIDHDNYDMKRIIDAICNFYPYEDDPLCTTMTIQTIVSDKIAPRTYAIVDQNFNRLFSDLDLFEVFGNDNSADLEMAEIEKTAKTDTPEM